MRTALGGEVGRQIYFVPPVDATPRRVNGEENAAGRRVYESTIAEGLAKEFGRIDVEFDEQSTRCSVTWQELRAAHKRRRRHHQR
jgi:hypothetical protein